MDFFEAFLNILSNNSIASVFVTLFAMVCYTIIRQWNQQNEADKNLNNSNQYFIASYVRLQKRLETIEKRLDEYTISNNNLIEENLKIKFELESIKFKYKVLLESNLELKEHYKTLLQKLETVQKQKYYFEQKYKELLNNVDSEK